MASAKRDSSLRWLVSPRSARGVETRAQLGGMGGRAGVAGGLRGERQPQQQHVGPAAALQQHQHLGGAALVEQEVGMRRLQIDVRQAQRLGLAERGLGGGGVAAALLDLGQPGQAPQAFGRAGLWVVAQGRAQAGGSRGGPAGGGIDLRRAGGCAQRRREWRQLAAAGARAFVVGAHHQDRRAPGASLDVVGLGAQDGVQIGQRLVEAVVELQQDRAQQAHRRRRIAQPEPGLQGGLCLADVARIALGSDLVVVALRQSHGQRQVLWILAQLLAQRVQFAGARIAAAGGHPLQHLGVVGGGVGRGRHQGRQAKAQQELRAAEHGGYGSRGGTTACRRCAVAAGLCQRFRARRVVGRSMSVMPRAAPDAANPVESGFLESDQPKIHLESPMNKTLSTLLLAAFAAVAFNAQAASHAGAAPAKKAEEPAKAASAAAPAKAASAAPAKKAEPKK